MSIEKHAGENQYSVETLNVPDWPEYNLVHIKTASVDKSPNYLGGFDIKDAIKQYPDNLFIKIFAIKKDEVNDNGDAFNEVELKKAYSSFVGVPIFCNHQNNDIEKARGKVVHAWYDEEKGGIYIIARVDRVAYPQLARGIENKIVVGTSMGTSVEASICSICHHCADTAANYCSHVKEQKNKKISCRVTCQYHDSPMKVEGYEDKCPLCGSTKDKPIQLNHDKQQVYEHNYGLKFIENSFVVNPACHECGVEEIFNITGLNKKIASLKENLQKISDVACSNGACRLKKVAGKQEIDFLTDAMDKIERVAKSMMAQKQHISMEYVSDLVKTLADVQGITDELIEMGYTQLPSPMITGDVSETPKTSQEVQPVPMEAPVATESVAAPGIVDEDISGIGSVTKPKFSSENILKKKKEFVTASNNLIEKLTLLQKSIIAQHPTDIQETIEKESDTMTTEKTDTVKIGKEQSMEKMAEHDTDVIAEKQLDDAKFTGERTLSPPDVITEKQLNNPKDVNVTTSATPQKRTGSYDVITEKQLDSVTSGIVARWNDWPEVITEKQWTDMSRLIGSKLSQDQSSIITEKQLLDFMSQHGYEDPGIITEKQLNDANSVQTKRWASDTSGMIKAAENSIADSIACFGKTPEEIKKTINYLFAKPQNLEKAAFLTIINSMSHKKEARKIEKNRYTYLSKLAQEAVSGPGVVDALILSMSDNLADYNIGDMLDALKHVASSKKALAQVERMVTEKMASSNVIEEGFDKTSAFDKAISEIDKPADGLYQVNVALADIGQDPSNKKAFLTALHKFADKVIGDSSVKTAITKVDLDEKLGTVTALLKDVKVLTAQERQALNFFEQPMEEESLMGDAEMFPMSEEDLMQDEEEAMLMPGQVPGAMQDPMQNPMQMQDPMQDPMQMQGTYSSRKQNRENIVKSAQMLGGEMGGQAGAAQAPGAGATLPQPPGSMGQPPVESFEQSDLGEGAVDDEALEPSPPGTRCPICGSDDVDMIGGKGKCNNCGADPDYELVIRVKNVPGFMGTDQNSPQGEEGAGEDEGEGFKMPESGEALPEAPTTAPAPAAAAASTTKKEYEVEKFAATILLRPESIKKIAESKIALGTVSPITGNTDTLDMGKGKHICLDTGTEYTVQYAVNKKDPKKVYARWIWTPQPLKPHCENCSRAKVAFVKALESMGTTEQDFDVMELKAKGDMILAMRKAGHLSTIKTASTKTGSIIEHYKKAATTTYEDKFPMESCQEKLARRYGTNALALSGPCEGKPLYKCICNSLKQAGIYSNNLAIKLAGVWGDKEGAVECLEDYVRMGYELKEAATICEAMKAKYAQFDDEFAGEIENTVGNPMEENGPPVEEEMEESPFENIDEDTVTLEIPKELVEKLDAALDTALGENPAEEEHHQEDMGVGPEVGAEIGTDVGAESPVATPSPMTEPDVPAQECSGGPVKPMKGAPTVDQPDNGASQVPATPLEGGEIADIAETPVADLLPENGGVEVAVMETGKEECDCDALAKQVLSGELPINEALDQIPEENQDELLQAILREKKGENKEGDETDVVEKVEEGVEDVLNPGKEEGEEELADEGETFKEGDETKNVPAPKEENSKSESENKNMTYSQTEEDMLIEAERMKRGHIGRTGEISLDLSGILKALGKTAGDKEVRQQNAQDTPELGKVKDNQKIGDEPSFTDGVAKKPDVPSANATMGKEEKDLNPSSAPKVKIPVGSTPMGHEKEQGLEGGDNRATGGDQGQGTSRAASTKERISSMADRILAAQEEIKKAQEKKVVRHPPQDDEDVKPYSGDSFIGNEKESIGEVPAPEAKPSQVPTTSGGFIGKEQESIGEKPTEKDTPDIPAKDDRIKGEKDNEKIAPEKEERVTGTKGTGGQGGVTASSDAKSKVQAPNNDAYKLAGRMLQNGMIEVSQLAQKVAELSQYGPSQLQDLAKAMFAGKKGLTTSSDGIEQPVLIGEASSEKDAQNRNKNLMKTAQDELKEKLVSIFSLSKENALADEDNDIQLRKIFGR